MGDVTPFSLAIPDEALADLRDRLARTRWPEAETVDDWSQGVPLEYLRDLCGYWVSGYDWRRAEGELNAIGQFKTEIDGLEIHFLHARSPHEDALPLLITHGWPGSVVEFLAVIGPLVDPAAHGGDGADAFHIVCPSLPGYGFSGKPAEGGWGVERIGAAWRELMARLGYSRYGAQGGDWGASVTIEMGVAAGAELTGIHLNMPIADPAKFSELGELTAAEQATFADFPRYRRWERGYSMQQSTRPQTIGYGLVDSPVGLCAWIVEKFRAWTDCDGDPGSIFTRDELLDNVMLYWLPATGASAARLYWESFRRREFSPVDVPTGCSISPMEILKIPRRLAETRFTDLRYWNELDRGGHFAAFEQPELFVDEVRAFFRLVR
jgi:pimeloyl-ACP methyl ester carboxylesterase